MPAASIEERLSAVETELDEIKKHLRPGGDPNETPWWERHFGAFKDSAYYDDAMRLGEDYRKHQPTAADAEPDNVST